MRYIYNKDDELAFYSSNTDNYNQEKKDDCYSLADMYLNNAPSNNPSSFYTSNSYNNSIIDSSEINNQMQNCVHDLMYKVRYASTNDSFKIAYENEVEVAFYGFNKEDHKWFFLDLKKKTRQQYNLRGGVANNNTLKQYGISIVGRFMPKGISSEYILPFNCSNISMVNDLIKFRDLVNELSAAYIEYVEKNYDKIEGIVNEVVDKYKSERIHDILIEKKNFLIMIKAQIAVMRKCFGIEIFNSETFEEVEKQFIVKAEEFVSPDFTVRDQFLDVTYKLIRNRSFIITELKDAYKNNSKDGIVLILDRKKGFLNFPKEALDMIAQMLPTVKDGDELAAILKACNSIYCTDNGARQITILGKRSAFYSVYLSEFESDILDLIDFCENEEYFFDPIYAPENFVPIVWDNGRCAGFVLDGEGLPNPHLNISGLSGMGKNRGAYKTAEGHWRLRDRVIFLDIKGKTDEEALKKMSCNTSRFCFHDLKTEGFPFPVFDLSAFDGKNAKVSYILNVIGAAVQLTPIQYSKLLEYVENMVFEGSYNFSLYELLEKLPPKKEQGLKNKLHSLLKIMNLYTPNNGKYKYSSCKEFIQDISKITILSIKQDSLPALRNIVYTLLQSLFEYKVIDSEKRLVVYADEIQKYTADSPFQKLYAEAREYNLCITAITQEYRQPGYDIHKISSNAAMEIFYPPSHDSKKRVSDKLGKNYSAEEHFENGVGYIWARGYFWSKTANKHMFVTLKGMNDDDKFSDLQSYPKRFYGSVY